jgi:hypothetical protein
MPSSNKGKYKVLDLKSVNNSAQKTITFLNNKLPALASHSTTIIFLGEQHCNEIDVDVSREILLHPPVLVAGSTRVILEKGLIYLTVEGTDEKTEPDKGLGPVARNGVIAQMIQDAIVNSGKTVVYVACGADHAQPVFNVLNKTLNQNFGFIVKPSSTD